MQDRYILEWSESAKKDGKHWEKTEYAIFAGEEAAKKFRQGLLMTATITDVKMKKL